VLKIVNHTQHSGSPNVGYARERMTFVSEPINDASPRMIRDVRFGEGVWVQAFTNLYGCEIGAGTRVGPFVEIQDEVTIGARCKIQSHSFICSGVSIGDGVFVGHGVMFVNDKTPRARNASGELATPDDWELLPVKVGDDVTIGSSAVVLGGVEIGEGAMIGAGAVVSRDVGAGETVAGVPARLLARD
jgi:UDP-2-acetamido-3-amino-2,3-dideoxy-glucuronate N-acetyltransferase